MQKAVARFNNLQTFQRQRHNSFSSASVSLSLRLSIFLTLYLSLSPSVFLSCSIVLNILKSAWIIDEMLLQSSSGFNWCSCAPKSSIFVCVCLQVSRQLGSKSTATSTFAQSNVMPQACLYTSIMSCALSDWICHMIYNFWLSIRPKVLRTPRLSFPYPSQSTPQQSTMASDGS